MDHPLRTISYIADIGNIVVLMARRRMPRSNSQENVEASHPSQDGKRQYKMICHVFESEDVRAAFPSSPSMSYGLFWVGSFPLVLRTLIRREASNDLVLTTCPSTILA